jgi:hypothetical protein
MQRLVGVTDRAVGATEPGREHTRYSNRREGAAVDNQVFLDHRCDSKELRRVGGVLRLIFARWAHSPLCQSTTLKESTPTEQPIAWLGPQTTYLTIFLSCTLVQGATRDAGAAGDVELWTLWNFQPELCRRSDSVLRGNRTIGTIPCIIHQSVSIALFNDVFAGFVTLTRFGARAETKLGRVRWVSKAQAQAHTCPVIVLKA